VVPTTSTVQIFIPSAPTNTSLVGNKTRHLLTQEVCDLPKEIGKCKGQRTRYFYNKDTNICELFSYSGCGGNQNNFFSASDCLRLCFTTSAADNSTSIPTNGSLTDNNNNVIFSRSLDANKQQPSQSQARAIYGETEVASSILLLITTNILITLIVW
jgi:hypothetical protein